MGDCDHTRIGLRTWRSQNEPLAQQREESPVINMARNVHTSGPIRSDTLDAMEDGHCHTATRKKWPSMANPRWFTITLEESNQRATSGRRE